MKETPWQQGMREFHQQTRQGGGAFEATIIRAGHAVALILSGEERYLKTIGEWFKVVRGGHQRPLCLACDHEFAQEEMPLAFCFAIPVSDQADKAIVTGVCERCGQKDDAELLEIAYRGFKDLGLANRKLETGTA
jgi:hypothetical protein